MSKKSHMQIWQGDCILLHPSENALNTRSNLTYPSGASNNPARIKETDNTASMSAYQLRMHTVFYRKYENLF